MASYVDVDTMSEDDICTFLQENKISDDEVQSVDELRQLIKVHMERLSKSHDAKDNEGHDNIQQTRYVVTADMLATDKCKRLDLCQLYEEVMHFHNELDKTFNLKKVDPYQIKEIEGSICDLEDEKCHLVVAGEVGSGKSSFLNLLIGQEIFPTSHLPWTSAICFLHNSDRQSMVLDGNQDITLPDIKTLIEQMEKYACHNRITGQRQCQRIDIYWPVPILSENVVLVDVPGIGENPDMDKMVLDYISKALICIYVVFSSNAGGVQKDKLKMILSHRFQSSDEEGVMNLLAHTLFVCNHWDEVEASGEETNVWTNILEQLKSCIKVLNKDSVVKISVKEAARNLKIGLEDTNAVKDFKKTLRRFDELLQKSLSAKTTRHFRIIATMLRKTENYLACLQKFVVAKREEQKEQMNTIKSAVSSMETTTTEFINDIKNFLKQKSEDISSKLHAFLHLKDTLDRLLNCKDEDDPSSPNLSSDKMVQVYMCQQRAKAKLERVIEEWEKQEKNIAGVQKEVQQKLQVFVSQNLNAVPVITLDNASQHEQLPEQWLFESSTQEGHPLPQERKIILGLSSPLWIPLGLAVGIIGLVIGGPIALAARAFKCAIVCRRFSNNEFQHMLYHLMKDIEKQMTSENVRKLVEQNYMLTLVGKIETLVKLNFDNTLHEKMQEIIVMNYDQRRSQQIHDSIGKAKSDLSKIDGRLKEYELRYMLPYKRIGEGQFSDLYRSLITNQGRSRDVAMKKFKRPIQPASLKPSELQTLRVLKHINIVEYVGVHVYSGDARGSDKDEKGKVHGDPHSVCQPSWENAFGKRLAIFLELCDESLEQFAFITYRLQKRLQSDDKASALAHLQTILPGICSGLVCIHDKGFMHRDLKLLNVLICNGVPKITDFGVSRDCDLSHNTMAGTVTHMSPKMLAHKTYSKPTDIYSMTILMWEFWYGQRSFELKNISIIDFGKYITTGSRLSMSVGVQMPNDLQELVTAFWDGDPDKRPTASKLLERFQIGFSK